MSIKKLIRGQFQPDTPVVDLSTSEIGLEEAYYDSVKVMDTDSKTIGMYTKAYIGLEDFHDTAESILADGGLNREAMAVTVMGLGFISKHSGLTLSNELPALEDFSNANGKMASTAFAMEAIKIDIKAIYEAILKFVKKFIASVKLFYTQYILSTKQLLANVKSLKAKIGSLGMQIKEGMDIAISGSNYGNLITDNSIDNFINELDRIGARVNALGLCNGFRKAIAEEMDFLEKIKWNDTDTVVEAKRQGLFRDKATFEKIVADTVFSGGVGADLEIIGDTKDLLIQRDKDNYIGETKAIFQFNYNSAGDVTSIKAWSEKDGAALKEEYTLSSLKDIEITKALDAIEDLLNIIIKGQSETQERHKLVFKIEAQAEYLAAKLYLTTLPADGDDYQAANTFIRNLSGITSLILEPSLSFQKQALASAKAAYNYCILSFKSNYA